ncbi:MAG: YceI family protein [Acidobacteria bacterium]|nr:YceI family protein [Acidobacteriota bacterium]
MRNRNHPLVVLASLTLIFILGGCETELDNKPAAAVGDARQVEMSTSEVETVNVLRDQSRIEWLGAKVTGQHDGGFREFDGSLSFEGDTPRQVSFIIDMGSIWSDTERLTGHLRTPDFFDVENHPEARFESTSVTEKEGDGETNYEISGNLEMRGKTNSISFPATVDMSGDTINAQAQFTIDRQLWDVSYKGAPDNLIRDDVLIKLDLVFPKPGAEGAVAQN